MSIRNNDLTEWEKSKEKDEFARAAKLFRPMSAMMSSRFVSGAMIDDGEEKPLEKQVCNFREISLKYQMI